MKVDWTPLDAALRQMRAAGAALPLWWRDDDAVTVTPQLDRLSNLSQRLGLPVHLAIIPAHLQDDLVAELATRPFIPVVHGWQHQSHSPPAQKNAEFGHPRPNARAELAQGLALMQDKFGPDLRRLFVPPWNRIAPEILTDLADLGYEAVSTYGPRSARTAAGGLVQINTHIDPIDWRGTRGLLPPEQIIAQTARLIADRTAGRTDAAEPLGYLTHHLVHDDGIWRFSTDLLTRLLDGGAVPCDLSPLP